MFAWKNRKKYIISGLTELQIGGNIRKLFFLFLYNNICCRYSLEVPYQGTSNEYLQDMFFWRNKENINNFWWKKSTLSGSLGLPLT